MGPMTIREMCVGLMLTVLAGGVMAVACGGDDGATGGGGQRVTDPAKVPSSTPIQGATLFQIRGDVVSLSGGTGGGGTPVAGQTPAGSKTYTVESGDTCGDIAKQFGISVDELLKANRTIEAGCTNLHAGDKLKIPVLTPTPGASGGGVIGGGPTPRPSGKEYKVVSGDTCDAIARSYGVDLTKLVAANGNVDCSKLQIGQTIKIP